MPSVEVFQTNVTCPQVAAALLQQLRAQLPGWRLSFDLDDCDHILRAQSPDPRPDFGAVPELLHQRGYDCVPLPD